MSKQVLSVEQMRHLKELGIDTSDASAVWVNVDKHGDWDVEFLGNQPIPHTNEQDEFVPAYTLQDVLDKLPEEIKYKRKDYHLELWLREGEWSIGYLHFDIDDVLYAHHEQDKEILNAAYEMLGWCIKEGYVNTKN